MSEGRALPLAAARRIADKLCEALAGACVRIEVAGSVRREKEFVHDLEIVAIPVIRLDAPLISAQASLFNVSDTVKLVPTNALWRAIEDLGSDVAMPLSMTSKDVEPDPLWQKKRTGDPEKRSRMFKLWLPRSQCKVDLFMPTAEGWGGVFTIRTGCAEFSEALVTRWKIDFHGSMKGGVLYRADTLPVATPEEEDFFRALRVEMIPPPLRHGAASLRKF